VSYRRFIHHVVRWASAHPDVVGLVAVGSTGGVARLPDAHSDHDLLVVTHDGRSAALRRDLTWLPDHDRIVAVHPSSEHGRGVVYDDGHLLEIAVLDQADVERVPIDAHRVLVDAGGVAARLASMERATSKALAARDPDGRLRVGTAVEELIVGLGRSARGEWLSAHERIAGRALGAVLGLVADLVEPEQPFPTQDHLDPFRRVEVGYPELAGRLRRAEEHSLHELASTLLGILASPPGAAWAVEPGVVRAVSSVLDRTRPPSAGG